MRVNAAGFCEIEVPATEKVAFLVALSRDIEAAPPPLANRGGCRTGSPKLESFD